MRPDPKLLRRKVISGVASGFLGLVAGCLGSEESDQSSPEPDDTDTPVTEPPRKPDDTDTPVTETPRKPDDTDTPVTETPRKPDDTDTPVTETPQEPEYEDQSDADPGEASLMISKVHWHRLVRPFVETFHNQSQHTVSHRNLYDLGRPWGVVTKRIRRDRDIVYFTSREDWEYRASEQDRETLRYVPFTHQLVERVGDVVGSVEYGLVVASDDPPPAVKAFVNFATGDAGQDRLAEPFPYRYAPLDAGPVGFDPPDWFNDTDPGDALESNRMWHGMAQIRGSPYFSTVLAELKIMWMTGFNTATGAKLPNAKEPFTLKNQAPLLEWADDHNFTLTYSPGGTGSEKVDNIATLAPHQNYMGNYAANEDFINRIVDTLFENVYDVRDGEAEKSEAVEGFETDFSAWLQEHHDSLGTLNERWGTSYASWLGIGLPSLPLADVQKWYRETGLVEGNLDRNDTIHTMFHQIGVHRHLLADDPAVLDFQRYMREAWARPYKALDNSHDRWDTDFTNHAKDLQPHIEDGQYYFTTKTRLNSYLFREVEEFNAAGFTHMICAVLPQLKQVPLDTIQIAQDKPLWNAEHHLYNHGTVTPSRVRYELLHDRLMGLNKTSAYNRATNFMAGRPDPGPYETTKREDEYRADLKARQKIRKHEDVFHAFQAARSDATLAVLVTEGNRGWNPLPDGPARPEMGGAIQAYGHVGALGRHWKYVLDEDVSAEHVTDTVIVAAPWLTTATAEKLAALPEDRRIVSIGALPAANEYGEQFDSGVLDTLESRTTVVEGWSQLSGEVSPVEGMFAPYTDVSDGSFWFWGGTAGATNYRIPVPKLELRRVRHDGKTYVSVTNHAKEETVNAQLPWASDGAVRELTAKTSPSIVAETDISFEPYNVRLFEIADSE